jgi:hypothetical protein
LPRPLLGEFAMTSEADEHNQQKPSQILWRFSIARARQKGRPPKTRAKK